MHRVKFLLLTAAVLAGTVARAEAQVITGNVTDAQNGVAVPAAQVFIAELNLGSLSEGNGSYTIENVPAGTHTVSVQRLGFRLTEQTVTVAGGQTVQLDFQLETEALSLDAVVVTGTAGGSQVRAIGNLVERVGVPDLAVEAPVQTVEDVLTGRIPGVMLLGQPNSAGDGAQIRIRGNSSIGIPGDPIVYIDGVRMVSDRGFVQRYSAASRLNDINPADIESIEVIKGPAAATLYGTEAANGVIQIITKRGEVGAPVFDFTAETGAMYLPDYMITRGGSPIPRSARAPLRQRGPAGQHEPGADQRGTLRTCALRVLRAEALHPRTHPAVQRRGPGRDGSAPLLGLDQPDRPGRRGEVELR